ncbi:unnamed protein product [Calypogeia fissa]
MHWMVGSDSAITEDQLLSTNDKKSVIKSVESDISILKESMREAVNLKIYPPELTMESTVKHHRSVVTRRVFREESVLASDGPEEATRPLLPRILRAVKEVGAKVDQVGYKVDKVSQELNDVKILFQEGFTKVFNEQRQVLRKLQDTERFFKEDKDRSCPNLIYLGEKNTGRWATLKQALSATVSVHLQFGCEAMYNNYRPHKVKDQKGLDVSAVKRSLRKIVPWL